MKVLRVFLIFSILSLNAIFAEEKPNLDDPKVQDQIIAIAVQKLDKRDNVNGDRISYLPFQQVPYTGWKVSFYDNGQVEVLYQIKDGKLNGLWTDWYENGQKSGERNYKDSKMMSVEAWKPNGEKCPVTNVKDGNGVLVIYNKDGTDLMRVTFKDGVIVLD